MADTPFKRNREYIYQCDTLWPQLRDLSQTPGFAETVVMKHIKDDEHY